MQLERNFLTNWDVLTVDDYELRSIGLEIGKIVNCIQHGREYPLKESVRVVGSVSLGRNCELRITSAPEPRHIYASHDERVVVIIWDDGSKTIARCSEGDTPDVERGIWAATMRRLYGSRARYKKLFGNVERQGE